MTTLCPVCARREPADGLTVCAVCIARIDDDLARIDELTTQAGDWLHPRTTGTSEGSRSVPGSRPPLSVDVLDAAIGLDVLPLLEEWIRATREHNRLAPYGAATEGHAVTVAGSVAFLRSWLLWAAGEPSWPIEDYATEIRDARWQLERLNPDQDRDEAARLKCPGEQPDADGRLCHATLTYDREHPGDDIACRRCGTTWTGTRLLLLTYIDASQVVWAYPAEITDRLGVTASTLRQWGKRGHIPRRNAQYDIGAVYRRLNTPITGVAQP